MAASEDQALPTSWPAELPLTAALLRQIIERHAPVIRFHPDEPYFPSSAEWYLARSLLIDGATGAVVARHPAATDLPRGPAAPDQLQRYWLTLDPALAGPALEPELAPPDDPRRGDLAEAPAYVRALHDPAKGHTDLQFWMFYPFDGPGLARLRPRFLGALRTDQTLSLWPAGMHEADWELAVIRIDHATLQPVAAFLSQHQNGDQHVGKEAVAALEREPDGRIRLHASLFGHASYAHPQDRKLVYFKRSLGLVGIELALIDRVEPGAAWDLSQNHQVISTSWHDPQFPPAPWLDYAWRWGAYDPNGGRFRRKLVDAMGGLLEGHLSPPVLVLHILDAGPDRRAAGARPAAAGRAARGQVARAHGGQFGSVRSILSRRQMERGLWLCRSPARHRMARQRDDAGAAHRRGAQHGVPPAGTGAGSAAPLRLRTAAAEELRQEEGLHPNRANAPAPA